MGAAGLAVAEGIAGLGMAAWAPASSSKKCFASPHDRLRISAISLAVPALILPRPLGGAAQHQHRLPRAGASS